MMKAYATSLGVNKNEIYYNGLSSWISALESPFSMASIKENLSHAFLLWDSTTSPGIPNSIPIPESSSELTSPYAILISACIAAVITIISIFSHKKTAKQRATLDYIIESEAGSHFTKVQREFSRVIRHSTDYKLYSLATNYPQSTYSQSIKGFLNHCELSSVSLRKGILDLKTYRNWMRSSFVNDFIQAIPFIYGIRAKYKRPAAYVEFETIAVKFMNPTEYYQYYLPLKQRYEKALELLDIPQDHFEREIIWNKDELTRFNRMVGVNPILRDVCLFLKEKYRIGTPIASINFLARELGYTTEGVQEALIRLECFGIISCDDNQVRKLKVCLDSATKQGVDSFLGQSGNL